MNYKVKSLVYLFAFILSALLCHQMEMSDRSEPIEQSGEISMVHTPDLAEQDTVL